MFGVIQCVCVCKKSMKSGDNLLMKSYNCFTLVESDNVDNYG